MFRLVITLGLLWCVSYGDLAIAQRVVSDPDIFETFNRPPPESLRNGTASLDEVQLWVYSEGVVRLPDGEIALPADVVWAISQPDLDLDGTKDLLIADRSRSGSGGDVLSAFLVTPNGYQYIGTVLAQMVVPVADNNPSRTRLVIRQHVSAAEAIYRLAELQADGLHEVDRVTLNGRDADVERLLGRLMVGGMASPDVLPLVFGDAP